MEIGKIFGKKGASVVANALSVFEKTKVELENGIELLDAEVAEENAKRDVVLEKRTVEDSIHAEFIDSNAKSKEQANKMVGKLTDFLK